jgi:hypothetical protein
LIENIPKEYPDQASPKPEPTEKENKIDEFSLKLKISVGSIYSLCDLRQNRLRAPWPTCFHAPWPWDILSFGFVFFVLPPPKGFVVLILKTSVRPGRETIRNRSPSCVSLV